MHSLHILSALQRSPLFLEDLPEGGVFDRADLVLPEDDLPLNLEQKLGYLYEEGLNTLLTHSPRYHILHRGLQLQEGKHKTVGELDFLFMDLKTEEVIHLELAVKFYLALHSPEGLLMPGPDSRDNYYNKLERLRTHQLMLPKRFPHLLPEELQGFPLKTQQLVIGCVFDHVNASSLASPPFLSPTVRRGVWVRQSEFSAHFNASEPPELIPKPLWPVPLEELAEVSLSSLDPSQPLLRCSMVRVKGVSFPVFIAPDSYPVLPDK